MNFDEFKEKIVSEMNRRIPDGEAFIHNIIKNNGIKLTGLAVVNPHTNVSPTIYLEEYFKGICQGEDFEEVFQKILEIYQENRIDTMCDICAFTDWKYARERIVVRLVNYEKNRELLQTVPHERFLDLAVVYFYIECIDQERLATILVHNRHLEFWGVGKEELAAVAYDNYKRYFPLIIKSMDEIVAEIMGEASSEVQQADEVLGGQMYIVTNLLKLHGAASLLFAENFRVIAERWNSDLYILPSSIHELIVVPVKRMEAKDLEETVREVNRTQVTAEEQLSDHVYRYLYQRGEIVMP